MRILIVEDETYIAEAIAQVLKKNNYSVDLAFDGEYGLDCALSNIYDFIILDIMLPKMNGLDVLDSLRQENITTPVILLTARNQIEDKVKGLDYGADDYLAKPFHTDELLARLRAIRRRNTDILSNNNFLYFGDISLDPNTLMLKCNNCEIKLTLKESQLLEILIERNNFVTSKEIIIEKLWGYDTDANDAHVETHMSLFRKKLSMITSNVYVYTIRGSGYILRTNNI